MKNTPVPAGCSAASQTSPTSRERAHGPGSPLPVCMLLTTPVRCTPDDRLAGLRTLRLRDLPPEIVGHVAAFMAHPDVLNLAATDTHTRHLLHMQARSAALTQQATAVRTNAHLSSLLTACATLPMHLRAAPIAMLAAAIPHVENMPLAVRLLFSASSKLPLPGRGPALLRLMSFMDLRIRDAHSALTFAEVFPAIVELPRAIRAEVLEKVASRLNLLAPEQTLEAYEAVLSAILQLPENLRAAPLAALACVVYGAPAASKASAYDQLLQAGEALAEPYRYTALRNLPRSLHQLAAEERWPAFARLHGAALHMPGAQQGAMLAELAGSTESLVLPERGEAIRLISESCAALLPVQAWQVLSELSRPALVETTARLRRGAAAQVSETAAQESGDIFFKELLGIIVQLPAEVQAAALDKLTFRARLITSRHEPARRDILTAAERLPQNLRSLPLGALTRTLYLLSSHQVSTDFQELSRASEGIPEVLLQLPATLYLLPSGRRKSAFSDLLESAMRLPLSHRGGMLLELAKRLRYLPEHLHMAAARRLSEAAVSLSHEQNQQVQAHLCRLMPTLGAAGRIELLEAISDAIVSLPPAAFSSALHELGTTLRRLNDGSERRAALASVRRRLEQALA